MERHFILPATFAAVFHAALLFGFHPSAVSAVSSPVASPKADSACPTIEVAIDQPKEELTTEPAAAPKGSPEERPSLPELPTTDAKGRMTVDVPATNPSASMPDKFDLKPPGRLDGSEVIVNFNNPLPGVGELDSPPRTTLQSSPLYPAEARHSGLTGTVTVEFTVDETGFVHDPHVVSSSDRVFEEATLRAVAKWRFEPGKRGGRIVRFRMAVPVVFNLNDN